MEMTVSDLLSQALAHHQQIVAELQDQVKTLENKLISMKKENTSLYVKGKHYSKECDKLKIENEDLKRKIAAYLRQKHDGDAENVVQKNLSLGRKPKRMRYQQEMSPEKKRQKLYTETERSMKKENKFLLQERLVDSEIFDAVPKTSPKAEKQYTVPKCDDPDETRMGDSIIHGNNHNAVCHLVDPDETCISDTIAHENYHDSPISNLALLSRTPKELDLSKASKKLAKFDQSLNLNYEFDSIPSSPVFSAGVHRSMINNTRSPLLFEEDDHSECLLGDKPIKREENKPVGSSKQVFNNITVHDERPGSASGYQMSKLSGTFKKPLTPKNEQTKLQALHKKFRKESQSPTKCSDKKCQLESVIDLEHVPFRTQPTLLNGSIDPDFQFSDYCGDTVDDRSTTNQIDIPVACENNTNIHVTDNGSVIPPFSLDDEHEDEQVSHEIVSDHEVEDVDEEVSQVIINPQRGKTNELQADKISTFNDSFDVVKKTEGVKYAYIDVVRKQDERRKLPTFSCRQCYDYYNDGQHTEEQIMAKMKEVCRHRAAYAPPGTPEGFWKLDFPDTPQEKDSTSQLPAIRRRRKPYKKMF